MSTFDLVPEIVDQEARRSAVGRLRAAQVILPTLAQLATPSRIPGELSADLDGVDPDEPRAANLFRVHWYNDARRRGRAALPGYLELPEVLTGVKARIVVALGCRFPLIGAHKVLAAYGCLVPRLVTGRFDPAVHKARLALDRQLLPRRRRDLAHPRLPRRRRAAGRHEPRALRLAAALGRRSRRHRPHARHREQRQGDLRQVPRARARPGERDPEPVLGVR